MNQEGRNRKEKPKWDAFHFRLPREKDQLKFIELYRRSGAKTKTDFIRHRILGGIPCRYDRCFERRILPDTHGLSGAVA